MSTSLKIGRLFGIPLHLHWTLLLVVGWIFYDGYASGYGMRWDRVAWVGGVISLLFFFVLVHELGHALTARFFGKPTEKILLFPLGGGAYIREQPDRTWAEILVYFGGPLANLLLALSVIPFFLSTADRWLLLRNYFQPGGNIVIASLWWEDLLCLTVGVNLVLAILNLIPAYPLDGGRILHALLRAPLGNRRSTLIVTALGLLASIIFAWLAWYLQDPIMGVGALFIAVLSLAEINSGWQRRRLKKYQVADLGRPFIIERLYTSDSVDYARQQLERSGWPALPVYDKWNEMQGILSLEIFEFPEAAIAEKVSELYDPSFASCGETDNLLEATENIIDTDSYGAIIYRQDRPVGILLMDDIMALLKSRFTATTTPIPSALSLEA